LKSLPVALYQGQAQLRVMASTGGLIMSLVTWSPFKEMDDVFDRYNRLLSRTVANGEQSASRGSVQWRPAANISETDTEYLIRAELPEVDKKDVEVTLHDGVLTIRGERRLEKRHESEKHHRLESFYGSFARSFNLPADVDEANIHAESKDGVLTVRLPKVEVAKPRPIEIKVG